MDAAATSRPRLAWLCPSLALWLLWREDNPRRALKSILLVLLLGAQVLLGLATLVLFGWARLDWDGRGLPGSLRWNQSSPGRANWTVSQNSVNSDDPANWLAYRGADRTGVYTGPKLRFDWDKNPPKQIWKTTIGGGHASVTVGGGRLFTLEQWDEGEAVTAYNLVDGRGLWFHTYEGAFNDASRMGGVGPRSTPTLDGNRLYTLGAAGQLFCFDAATGKVIWQKDAFEVFETRNIAFGMCGSPLVAGDRLILTLGLGKFTVVALDKKTGDVIWKTDKAEKQAYMSPITATLAGRDQLILGAAREMQGLSLDDGKKLWKFDWRVTYDNNIAQPVVINDDHIFISAGYGKGCALLKITDQNGTLNANQIWFNKELKNKFTSSVLHKGHLYGLDDAGGENAAYLTCIEAMTGQLKWRGDENYGHGQVLLADGHLIIQCENGDLALARAKPDAHELIARIPSLDGRTWNNPALTDGRLFVRHESAMACYNLRKGSDGGGGATPATNLDGLTILLTALLLTNGFGCMLLGMINRE